MRKKILEFICVFFFKIFKRLILIKKNNKFVKFKKILFFVNIFLYIKDSKFSNSLKYDKIRRIFCFMDFWVIEELKTSNFFARKDCIILNKKGFELCFKYRRQDSHVSKAINKKQPSVSFFWMRSSKISKKPKLMNFSIMCSFFVEQNNWKVIKIRFFFWKNW